MRVHTKLTAAEMHAALNRAVEGGGVSAHVHLNVLEPHRSRSRARAFEVKLATVVKLKGDGRHHRNTGTQGAGRVYAATYDEWGFFLAEVFKADPEAVVADFYDGEAHFHEKTRGVYSKPLVQA